MKVAISVERDVLLEQADAAARSALIAVALKDYLRHREQPRITAQLNEIYKDGPTPEERLVSRMRSKLPIADRW